MKEKQRQTGIQNDRKSVGWIFVGTEFFIRDFYIVKIQDNIPNSPSAILKVMLFRTTHIPLIYNYIIISTRLANI